MIYAILEFPPGDRVFYGSDHRWAGENALIVETLNTYGSKRCYPPQWPTAFATEIAEVFGGKVVYARKLVDRSDPDALH